MRVLREAVLARNDWQLLYDKLAMPNTYSHAKNRNDPRPITLSKMAFLENGFSAVTILGGVWLQSPCLRWPTVVQENQCAERAGYHRPSLPPLVRHRYINYIPHQTSKYKSCIKMYKENEFPIVHYHWVVSKSGFSLWVLSFKTNICATPLYFLIKSGKITKVWLNISIRCRCISRGFTDSHI